MVYELKPIRTEADHNAALREVERLWGAKLGTPKGDRLDILITLIEAYEDEHYPMDPPDPIEAIKFRMEQQGLTRKDPGAADRQPNARGRDPDRKRNLSIAMIRRLAAGTRHPGRGLGAPDEAHQPATVGSLPPATLP